MDLPDYLPIFMLNPMLCCGGKGGTVVDLGRDGVVKRCRG